MHIWGGNSWENMLIGDKKQAINRCVFEQSFQSKPLLDFHLKSKKRDWTSKPKFFWQNYHKQHMYSLFSNLYLLIFAHCRGRTKSWLHSVQKLEHTILSVTRIQALFVSYWDEQRLKLLYFLDILFWFFTLLSQFRKRIL